MMISNIFVPNKELRQKFQHQVDAAGISQLGVLGLVATQTAYEKGDEWYENMLKYVWENIAYVKKYVKDNMPGVNVIDGEGTYLLWLDFRGTGIDADELDQADHLRRKAVAGQRKDLRKDRNRIPEDQCGGTEEDD